MKKWIALLICAALLLCSGCAVRDNDSGIRENLQKETESTQSAVPVTETQTAESVPAENTAETESAMQQTEIPTEIIDPEFTIDQLEGIYLADDPGYWDEQTLQIRCFGEYLLLEVGQWSGGSLEFYWAEEFWPDPYGVGYGEEPFVMGKCQSFSNMAVDASIYPEPAQSLCITMTGEGIALQYEGMDTQYYNKTDSHPGIHDNWEEYQNCLGVGQIYQPHELVGTWEYYDDHASACFRFWEDGKFIYVCKERNQPVVYLEGAWSADQERIYFLAEQYGCADFPYEWELDYSIGQSGDLHVSGDEGLWILPAEGECRFNWITYPWIVGFSQTEMMGLFYELYGLEGTHEDQYGNSYEYRYYLPRFHSDDEMMQQVNEGIEQLFAPVIENELEYLDNGEPLVYHSVDWQYYVWGNVVSLVVRAESDYEIPAYVTYNYDADLGKFLSNEELLAYVGVTPEEFLAALENAALACFELNNRDLPEEMKQSQDYQNALAFTTSEQAIYLDIPMFIDSNAEFTVMGQIGSMAGAGWYYAYLYPFSDGVG